MNKENMFERFSKLDSSQSIKKYKPEDEVSKISNPILLKLLESERNLLNHFLDEIMFRQFCGFLENFKVKVNLKASKNYDNVLHFNYENEMIMRNKGENNIDFNKEIFKDFVDILFDSNKEMLKDVELTVSLNFATPTPVDSISCRDVEIDYNFNDNNWIRFTNKKFYNINIDFNGTHVVIPVSEKSLDNSESVEFFKNQILEILTNYFKNHKTLRNLDLKINLK